VEKGNTIKPWTLDWDDNAGVLRMMRSKETEADYRYFHEPDLLPLEISKEWQGQILQDLPELPLERRARFMREFQIPEYDADILTSDRDLADYFEETMKQYKGDAKKISNWLMNDVLRMRNELGKSMAEMKLSPIFLAELVHLTDDGKINITTAKNLLSKIQDSGKSPQSLVEELGLAVVSDETAIRAICGKIVAQNPAEVQSYRDGKESLIGWFVGQVMRELRGKADPKLTQQILKELLEK
jgi:aspartyl-tRNA(Asn)/glutamyl-tRNA(Gln) amidotransferase subunit B